MTPNKITLSFLLFFSSILFSCTFESTTTEESGKIKFINYYNYNSYSIQLRCDEINYSSTKYLSAGGSVIFDNLDPSEYYAYSAKSDSSSYPDVIGTVRVAINTVLTYTIR